MKPFVFSKVFVIECPLLPFKTIWRAVLFFSLPDAVHYQVAILSMKHFPVFCLTSVFFFFPFCLFVLFSFLWLLLLLLLRTGEAFQCWSFSFLLERSLFFKSILWFMSLLCCVASVGVIILPFSFASQPLKFAHLFLGETEALWFAHVYFLEEIKAFVDLRSVHIAVNRFYSLALFRDFVKLDIWIYDLLYVRIEKAAVCLFPRAHICAGR